jgi:hypothetical protein
MNNNEWRFNMAYPTDIRIGDRIRYECGAGTIRGEIVNIVKGMNAADQMIDWVVIEYINQYNRMQQVRLAVSSLAMFKFKVIFRDYDMLADQYVYERMMEAA